MKTLVSMFWVIAATAFLSGVDDGPRPDPDIFDGRFAGEAGATAGSPTGEAREEAETDKAAEADGGGEEEDTGAENGEGAGTPEGESTEAKPGNAEPSARNGADRGAENQNARSGNGIRDFDLGELPEVGEIRIGGTGGIERPVEPETVEIPRVEMPSLPEARLPEQAPVAEAPEDPDRSPDDERTARGDEHQPRNDPVRRVGEGSTVPTDF